MQTVLPDMNTVATAQKMRIYRTQLCDFPYNHVKTHLDLVDERTKKRSAVSANIYRIDDPNVIGYMPSKIWHDDGGFNMLFYTSPALPNAARPFGDKPCYAFTLYVRYGISVEYDWQTRIFIDQIQTKVGMAYVFLFSEVDAKSIMQTQWNGDDWVIERPGIEKTVGLELYRDPGTFICDASDMAQC